MISFIAGIILLAIPFLLVSLFEDKKKGFIYILFFLILFHAFLAVLTQIFGIFYYPVILIATLLADIVAIIYWSRGPRLGKNKIDWLLLTVVAISFLTLFQVHYHYTGAMNLATDQTVTYHQVKDMKYVYPYFSDEWYAVSFIKYSINSHHLPFKNSLSDNLFINLEVFFHSFLSEIFLILGLNPLTQYVLVSIFFNILIIVLAYVFLRICGVSNISSSISSLSILYIACGANFPGIWHLLPVSLGILLSLAGLCFLELKDLKAAFLSFIAVTLFYPPFFIFSGLGFLIFLFFELKNSKNSDRNIFKKINYFLFAGILAVIAICIFLMISPQSNITHFITSKLFFISSSGYYIPMYNVYDVIPIPIILLALLGLYPVYKKRKYIFYQLVLGSFLWIIYLLTIYRIIIEFERVVFFTAIIVMLVSGFGLAEIEKYIGFKFNLFGKLRVDAEPGRSIKNSKIPRPPCFAMRSGQAIFKYAGICIIILFLALIPLYTQRENWKKFTPIDPATGSFLYPKSPANNYLTEDDIRIFKNIKGKIFFSIPWKGLVIGVATDNFPLITKEGTGTIGSEDSYYSFINSDCNGKKSIIAGHSLDYVYIPEIDCPGFEKIDESSERLILYKVNGV